MAGMNDILVRLIMDANGYNRDISKAENKTKQFEKNIRSNINAAAGMFTKFAGAVGLGVGALESLDKAIKSSQTTSDKYDQVMRAATSSVNSFFTAISTGDFSAFTMGMDKMISKAMAAQQALDQLGNTTMSYGYFSSRNQADYSEALNILRDKSSSADEKAAAKATVDRILGDQREITAELERRTKEAVGALMVEGNLLDASMITRDVIDNALRLDVSATGDAQKKELQARYKQYQKLLNESMSRHTVTTYSSSNWGTQSYSTTNMEEVNREMAAINAEYLDAIVYNEMLVRKNDDWLKNLIGTAQAADNAKRAYEGMVSQARKAAGSAGTPTTGSGGKSVPEVFAEGSIGYINQQLQQLQKMYEKAADEGTRMGIKRAMVELEQQRSLMNSYASYVEPSVTISKKIPGTDLSKINIPDNVKLKPADVQVNNDYAESLAAIGTAMGAISTMTGDGAAAWLSWGANAVSAIAQVLPAIETLIAAKTAEGAVSAGASAAQTPLVGWLLAGGAIAAFLAAVASVPKFAEGGVIGGSSFIGDRNLALLNSGEMVLSGSQQAKLFDMINNGSSGSERGRVEFVIKGQELFGVLQNFNNKRGKVR